MTAGWLDDVRDPPGPAVLALMAESIAPGGRIRGLRRLGGGLGAATHAFILESPEGDHQLFVLRRYPRLAIEEDPDIAVRSWRTLQMLARYGVAAPEPVWADLDCSIFETPSYVTSHLPGDSSLRPPDRGVWVRGLAVALAALHRTRFDRSDLSFLPGPEESLNLAFRRATRESVVEDPHGRVVGQVLAAWRPRLRTMTPVLCHGDYWAGNTLWHTGKMTAIVDWDQAMVGFPGLDAGYCRMDLALQHGQDVANDFLQAYEAAAGMRIPQLHLWDLLGSIVAMPDQERWLPGFHELGRTDLTPEIARERLAAFVDDALMRSGADGAS
jgi:aminoglycoside phosphotransferase (APT) family kinase protein